MMTSLPTYNALTKWLKANAQPNSTKPIDLYLIWALLTRFRYFADEEGQVAVIIECKESIQCLLDEIQAPGSVGRFNWLVISSLYSTAKYSIEPSESRYCTARISFPVSGGWKDAATRLLALHSLQSVSRFEISGAISAPVVLGPLDIKPLNPKDTTPVLALIDDFIGYAHSDFVYFEKNKWHSDVRAIWHQGKAKPIDVGDWASLDNATGYGYELEPSSMNAKLIEDLKRAYPRVVKAASHGTFVASTLRSQQHQLNPTDSRQRGERAARPCIVGVQLPRATVEDTSGGGMPAQILDGLRYILAKAGARRAVVCISYGTHAGTHDGTSIVECAMDELIALRNGGLSICLPTGNHREQMGHADFDLSAQARSKTLAWQVMPDDASPNFLEIWPAGLSFGRVSIEVISPSGKSTGPLTGGVWPIGVRPPGAANISGLSVILLPNSANASPPSNQATRVPILIALEPTKKSGVQAATEHGVWLVKVSLVDGENRTVHFDAYIERNDTLYGRKRKGRQSRFVDSAYELPKRIPAGFDRAVNPHHFAIQRGGSYIRREGCFNTFATGIGTIASAGFVLSTKSPCDYSGCGPVWANDGVDVAAASDQSTVLRGFRGAGNAGVQINRINGTSVAAPIVARWLYRWPGGSAQLDDLAFLWQLANQDVFGPPVDHQRLGFGRIPI